MFAKEYLLLFIGQQLDGLLGGKPARLDECFVGWWERIFAVQGIGEVVVNSFLDTVSVTLDGFAQKRAEVLDQLHVMQACFLVDFAQRRLLDGLSWLDMPLGYYPGLCFTLALRQCYFQFPIHFSQNDCSCRNCLFLYRTGPLG